MITLGLTSQGFFLGLLGSLHCLGMCGGLALASRRRGNVGLAAYQTARLAGYCLLGALSGAFGSVTRLWLGGPAVMATVGVLLIAYGLGWLPQAPRLLARSLVFFAPILKQPSLRATALMGGLTALLPCGLLGAAYLKAGASLGPWAGAIFMATFWLGTLPALLITSSLSILGDGATRQKILAGAMVVMGLVTLLQALWPISGGEPPMLPGCHGM